MRERLRRLLRVAAVGVAVLVVPGALLLAAVAYGAIAGLRKADPEWKPTLAVLAWARLWTLVYRVPYSMALAILHNEGASTPRALSARELRALGWTGPAVVAYPPGDVGDSRGPSVGPGQVLRQNVERLAARRDAGFFLVRRAAAQLAQLGEERSALWYSVVMMREALDESAGDVHAGIARYNGHGSAAQAYADRAEDFLDGMRG